MITLLTDFGTEDGYTAAMKGQIVRLYPRARVVDISHAVPAQDIVSAAFALDQALPWFPRDTVHVIVVDPGVGTDRAILAVEAGEHRFLAPDNGVLQWVLSRCPQACVRNLETRTWISGPVSATFHGRDLFAPAAALWDAGLPFEDLGSVFRPRVPMPLPEPEPQRGGWLTRVIHVDRFGNSITGVRESHLASADRWRISGQGWALEGPDRTYMDAPPGQALALTGSHGFIEIAVNQGNAARRLGLKKGSEIRFEPV